MTNKSPRHNFTAVPGLALFQNAPNMTLFILKLGKIIQMAEEEKLWFYS